ncbi:acyl transferase/acyl hydrolase/lysophospholipase [Gorgonomyces haynaldii]|nr:acyl transferase/acyl hydrolase/lysophospholipase [Gorgonomyces haynaldii]
MLLGNLLLYGLVRASVKIQEIIWRRLNGVHVLSHAKNYDDWVKIAKQLDERLGLNEWKTQHTEIVNTQLLVKITQRLRKYRARNDIHALTNCLIHSACRPNIGGVDNPRVYSMSYYGTAHAVQQYYDEMLLALDFIAKSDHPEKDKRLFFQRCFDAYGTTALCLSGGGAQAYVHFGITKALLDDGCLPQIVTGSSAGCMIACLIGTRTDDELKDIIKPELADKITACETSYLERFRMLIKTGAMFDFDVWHEKFQYFSLGSTTFLEAHKRTGRILNICVTSVDGTRPKVLNYITAPNIVISSAVLASAAIPLVLLPVKLLYKTPTGKIAPFDGFGNEFRDGSFVGDIPEQEIFQMFHVKYTIVGQANPHIRPFFYNPRGSPGQPTLHRYGNGWRGGFISSALVQFLRLDLIKWLGFVRDMQLLPRVFKMDVSRIFLQQFEGTVTILPSTPSIIDLMRVLNDPSRERFAQFLRDGQLQTWPKLCMISNRAKLEQCIGQWRAEFRQRKKKQRHSHQ